jgi:DNA-binding IclR family transcriptional regulator
VTDGTQLKHAPAILEALRDASGGLTVANLEKLLEVNRGTVHRTLDTLCGTGRVSESGGVYYAV